MRHSIKYLILLLILCGCNNYKTKYPYSLSNFRPELRKHLDKLISQSLDCDKDSAAWAYLYNHTSVQELKEVFRSEHPELRGIAFRMLTYRDSANTSELLMNNLDDSAKIYWCDHYGEYNEYLSDYYIEFAKRKTWIKQKYLADEIILKHSYLKYAAIFAFQMDTPQKKYYPIIKANSLLLEEVSALNTKKANYLGALARYRKPEDVSFITQQLLYGWRSGWGGAFRIIEENPDTAYFKVLKAYYNIISSEISPEGVQASFSSTKYSRIDEEYEQFLNALTVYKNKQSAEILTEIVKRKLYPFYPTGPPYNCLIYELLTKNYCEEYKKLLSSLKNDYDRYMKTVGLLEPYTLDISGFDTTRVGYW